MTMTPRFLQIHYLTAYPASLLNRDDAGMAKRVPFGGVSRLRISSQCLKRHWRRADGENSLSALGVDLSVRSRRIFEDLIAKPLIQEGLSEDAVRPVLKGLQSVLLGESEKKGKKDEEKKSSKDAENLETSQVIILGQPEIEFIKRTAREFIARDGKDRSAKALEAFLKEKDRRQNLDALKRASGLDAAMFGRMVTSDLLARGDAAVHVAHAFTVHREEAESDYFTAVDDLVVEAGETGSGHINESELTSGLYYGYVVIDISQLVMNLEGVDRRAWESADRSLAAKVVDHLVQLIATVSPGAKLGSTAPYSCALLLLIEAGNRQPRTLANAFLSPVDSRRGDLVGSTVSTLSNHLKAFDAMYGAKERRMAAAMVDISSLPAEAAGSLAQLASWAASQVRG